MNVYESIADSNIMTNQFVEIGEFKEPMKKRLLQPEVLDCEWLPVSEETRRSSSPVKPMSTQAQIKLHNAALAEGVANQFEFDCQNQEACTWTWSRLTSEILSTATTACALSNILC